MHLKKLQGRGRMPKKKLSNPSDSETTQPRLFEEDDQLEKQ
jgi:hypothetical protein